MRITGGEFGGRNLKVPKSDAIRPTQDRVREALFNIIQFEIAGADFLDLFAGSGAVGLEALSRGAKSVTFVERERRHLAVLNENGGFPGPGGQRRKPRGANHAAEMSYVFATPWGPFSPEDQKVSDAMHKYWGNFVKYGNPNGEGLDEWPVYDEDSKSVMFFKNGTTLIDTPNMPQLQLMEEFFKWKREDWKPRQ